MVSRYQTVKMVDSLQNCVVTRGFGPEMEMDSYSAKVGNLQELHI